MHTHARTDTHTNTHHIHTVILMHVSLSIYNRVTGDTPGDTPADGVGGRVTTSLYLGYLNHTPAHTRAHSHAYKCKTHTHSLTFDVNNWKILNSAQLTIFSD